MSKNDAKPVPETALDKELATIGVDKQQQYQKIFRPLEQYAIHQVVDKSGGMQKQAQGITNANEEQQFGLQHSAVAAASAASGAAPGSGRFNLGQTQFSADQGQAMGLGSVDTANMGQRNLTSNIQSLIDIGQGKSGSAIQGLSTSAQASQQQAVMDARASVAAHQALLNAVGTGVGFAGTRLYQNRGSQNGLQVQSDVNNSGQNGLGQVSYPSGYGR